MPARDLHKSVSIFYFQWLYDYIYSWWLKLNHQYQNTNWKFRCHFQAITRFKLALSPSLSLSLRHPIATASSFIDIPLLPLFFLLLHLPTTYSVSFQITHFDPLPPTYYIMEPLFLLLEPLKWSTMLHIYAELVGPSMLRACHFGTLIREGWLALLHITPSLST